MHCMCDLRCAPMSPSCPCGCHDLEREAERLYPSASVAALFVDPVGPYVGLPNVDPWDERRDARKYAGPLPVVAHPPCERWGRFAEGAPKHKTQKLGDDGGCFKAALEAVRRFGGVIEHPQGSHAFHHFRLPIPDGKWTPADAWGGRSCYIWQRAYGHKAAKPTWLYAVLPAFPAMDWTQTPGPPYIGGDGFHSASERRRAKARADYKPVPQIPREENHLTPPLLVQTLVDMAQTCHGWQPKVRHSQKVLA